MPKRAPSLGLIRYAQALLFLGSALLAAPGCGGHDSGVAGRQKRGPASENTPNSPAGEEIRIDDYPNAVAFGFTASGMVWSERNISVSFAPDGTEWEGYRSGMFAMLDAVAPRAIWQQQYLRALQTWAEHAPLNFHVVSDDGSPSGAFGSIQGDSRFGDIRFGSRVLGSNVLGQAHFPNTGGASTEGGDFALNSSKIFGIGSMPDLYSVCMHEIGHALGLDHSTLGTAVMYGGLSGIQTGLTSDDIAGIRYIYGPRRPDLYDEIRSNDSLGDASSVALSSGGIHIEADLTTRTDTDYYRLVVPASTTGALAAKVDASGRSLMAPQLAVYDASGKQLSSTKGAAGGAAAANLSGLIAGQTLFIRVDGATDDQFGVGAYVLDAKLAVSDGSPADTQNPTIAITAPVGGTSISATTTIAASATDNVGVAYVEFFQGSSKLGVDTDSPYTHDWDTTGLVNGTYDLTARAVDAAGHAATSSIVAVSVANVDATPPTVALLAPAEGASILGSVTIQANASDAGGVARVEFFVDGVSLGSDAQAPYGWIWVTTSTGDGAHILTAKAYDLAGNAAVSREVTVEVTNLTSRADTSAPSAPASLTASKQVGKRVSVLLSWTSSTDDVGVKGFHVYRDGVRYATVSSPTYTDSRISKRTGNSYFVTAFDAADNESAPSNTVTVAP